MLKAFTPSLAMFSGTLSPSAKAPPTNRPAWVVAGQDISGWSTVDVKGVPPGPLGILLDGAHLTHAVLDQYAPVSSDGTKGVVELDGRITPGSVLIAVNDHAFIQDATHHLSLQEIGRLLRETGGMTRTLRFKVPPLATPSDDVPVSSASVSLLSASLPSDAKTQASPTASTGSWSIMSMLSPRTVQSLEPELTAATAATMLSPLASPVSGSGLRAASPTGSHVAVTVPPGPIGLNLDSSIPQRAVVMGFQPLPSGGKGVLEMEQGEALIGAWIVAINEEDTTSLPLVEIRSRLTALAAVPRELVFQLPTARELAKLEARARAAQATAILNSLSDLDRRRKLELRLVLQHDRSKKERHECWLLISAPWMTRWITFTARGGPAPGPISNDTLLQPDWKLRQRGLASGRADEPRPGMKVLTDYRGVTPLVWSLLVELHGDGNVPLLGRFLLDASGESVDNVREILAAPRLKAASLVHEIRERCPKAFA